jgi:hypothetical protein
MRTLHASLTREGEEPSRVPMTTEPAIRSMTAIVADILTNAHLTHPIIQRHYHVRLQARDGGHGTPVA